VGVSQLERTRDGLVRVLITADAHHNSIWGRHPAWTLVLAFASEWGPDLWWDLGDFAEWDFLARQSERNKAEKEGRRFGIEFDWLNEQLDDMQASGAELSMFEGNHDDRINRYMEEHPEAEDEYAYYNRLYFKQRGITWYPLEDQPVKLTGGLYGCHGWFHGTTAAKRHLEAVGASVIFGHGHKFQRYEVEQHAGGKSIWGQEIACLTHKRMGWARGKPMLHQNGFAIAYIDHSGGDFRLYPIEIAGNSFLCEGEKYSLKGLLV
jgi:hypothetical protein